MVSSTLLDILVCPACKSKVVFAAQRIVCTSDSCGLRYPVRDGIPVMLVDEAESSAH